MFQKMLFSGAAVAILSAAALPALASTESISQGTWYTAHFNSTANTPVIGGVILGATGIDPAATPTTVSSTSWSVDLTGVEALTVVDVELSGDRFAVFDNGVALGDTTAPVGGDGSCGESITCALGDSNYSRGVFALHSGVNDITIEFLGVNSAGDVDFFVGAPDGGIGTPEPATWALMLAGFAGLGAALRVRRTKAAPA